MGVYMINKVLIICLFSVYYLYALDFGKTYNNAEEPMTIEFYKEHTRFDWTLRGKDSLKSDVEDVQSKLSDLYGMKKLETKDVKDNKKNYLLLDCTIDRVDFVTLLRTTTIQYRNWAIEYCYYDTKKRNYIYTPILCPVSVQKVSNFIKETHGNEVLNYCPESFGLFSIPWAVSAAEKNKSITFICNYSQSNIEPIKELIIVNGFVSVEKESLYSANARAKKIKISYDNTSFIYELKDAANYQSILLPEELQPKEKTPITLEILDTYKGEKYQDVVISAILTPEFYMEKKHHQ